MFMVQAILRKKSYIWFIVLLVQGDKTRQILREILVYLTTEPFNWHFSKKMEFLAKLFHVS